jgi:hypothetical protein
MLKRIFFFVCLLCATDSVCSQDSSQPVASTFDSVALMNELLQLLDSVPPVKSYAMVTTGVSNRLFSLRNNRLNAGQATTSTLVYTPTVGYNHKSGLSISAGASLLNDRKKGFRATQFSITPAFDLNSRGCWQMGISYTYYHITDRFSEYASPFQHDWYASASYNKWWLQPGLALGYSTGRFTEIFSFKLPTGNMLVDTGTYRLRAFSVTASVDHHFDWEGVFSKKDALSFTPTLLLNMASDSTRSISHTVSPAQIRLLSRRRRIPKLQGSNRFQVQSVGMSVNFSYNIGNWLFMPQLYVDYFLPATNEKRLTTTFALTAGYSF